MNGRIFFVSPETSWPAGGVNVMFQFAEILTAHGWRASVHFETPDFVYPFFDTDVATTYSPYRRPRARGLRGRMRHLQAARARHTRKGANTLCHPAQDDIVVIPEYCFAEQAGRFGAGRTVMLAQDVFGSARGALAPLAGQDIGDVLCTSAAAQEMLQAVTGRLVPKVPLFLDRPGVGFQAKKKKQIAYMPRKRRGDAALLVRLLKTHPVLQGYEFVAIDGLSDRALQQVMAEALIFLSFSWQEGFGLPPAEAMAMGSLVIGYAGVGGREYFSPDYAFPIPDDDIAAFYRTVVEVAGEYERDPARLDGMRGLASRTMLATYSRRQTEEALLKAFQDIGNGQFR